MDGVKFLGRQLIFKKGFASKVMRRTWIQVSTTCGSGWVDVEHAIFLLILNAMVDPPVSFSSFFVAPLRWDNQSQTKRSQHSSPAVASLVPHVACPLPHNCSPLRESVLA